MGIISEKYLNFFFLCLFYPHMVQVFGEEILAIHMYFVPLLLQRLNKMLKAMTEKSYAFSTIFLVTNSWKKRMLFVAKMSHAENFQKL